MARLPFPQSLFFVARANAGNPAEHKLHPRRRAQGNGWTRFGPWLRTIETGSPCLMTEAPETEDKASHVIGDGAFYALPPILNDLADVIGRDKGGLAAAVAIGLHYGGRRVYIPRNLPLEDDHQLIKLVGVMAARKLARHYDGLTLTIPPTLIGQQGRRRATVIALHAGGASQCDIAHRLGIARSTVQRILHKAAGPRSI